MTRAELEEKVAAIMARIEALKAAESTQSEAEAALNILLGGEQA